MQLDRLLPLLLALAWLLPLACFALVLLAGHRMGKGGRGAGYLATAAIVGSFLLSMIALAAWFSEYPVGQPQHAGAHAPATDAQPITGDWYALARFGSLEITIGYYIDGLTILMFSMVTLVASCIHVYSFGYMHEELHRVTDPLVTLADGRQLLRRGRFHRFYQYLSLFSFSMLGLVIAGNLAMVFIFWELVGICSYLLIGFYFERESASTAANKAFIVNRVGDFGMIVGLMALFSGLGTFAFDEIFAAVDPQLLPPSPQPLAPHLLTVAGLGIFCGCVGKSVQFPLHVWLPDAMEGPTPVSALIHAAAMVAAGVYLVGRFYPAFTPEVLTVIAWVGAITLFLAATMAITATDIKRVLAYSTVSQLGYMMLGLGAGGWIAGLFHLVTHACFKALLFLGSGSVIHATGTNEMPEMGGLRKKMPWTAGTMLVGCLAISGAGLPLAAVGLGSVDIGLSGFHSKDLILAAVFPYDGRLFYVAMAATAITAFYMFRLWYMTFAGTPRRSDVYEHAHESPRVMCVPLVVLAALAVVAAWPVPLTGLGVRSLLEQAQPASVAAAHVPHEAHDTVSLLALAAALLGFALATAIYSLRLVSPGSVKRAFLPVYLVFRNKWWFDELYRWAFVRPTLWLARATAAVDRTVIDGVADGSARSVRGLARLDDWFDRLFVDRLVDLLARWTYRAGLSLRVFQTGKLRQYVLVIAVGTVGLFVLIVYWSYAVATK